MEETSFRTIRMVSMCWTIESVEKIEVSLNAVGKAPKLKTNKFKLKKSYTFQHLIQFVRSQLEKGGVLSPKDSLVSI